MIITGVTHSALGIRLKNLEYTYIAIKDVVEPSKNAEDAMRCGGDVPVVVAASERIVVLSPSFIVSFFFDSSSSSPVDQNHNEGMACSNVLCCQC